MKYNGLLAVLMTPLFFASCSSLKFTSEGKIPLYFKTNAKYQDRVIIQGFKDYFLWGLYPSEQTVYIDKEARKRRYQALSGITLEKYQRPWQVGMSILTLGLYTPISFKITAKGLRKDERIIE